MQSEELGVKREGNVIRVSIRKKVTAEQYTKP